MHEDVGANVQRHASVGEAAVDAAADDGKKLAGPALDVHGDRLPRRNHGCRQRDLRLRGRFGIRE
jgi:hypothetical protein